MVNINFIDWFFYDQNVHIIRTDSELSHRQLYEAVSLYWHRRGRAHLLFVPAVQVESHSSVIWICYWGGLVVNACVHTQNCGPRFD